MPKSTKSSKHNQIRQHYSPLVRPGAKNHEMLDWSSHDAQIARFMVLTRCMKKHGLLSEGGRVAWQDPRGRSAAGQPSVPLLLDVGSGLTDLQSYFEWKDLQVRYVGVDITPAIACQAQRNHPDRDILLADVFQAAPFRAAPFDVVFCSGTLNLRLGNNQAFAACALRAMFALSHKLVVVNFLHERTRERYNKCFYYSPGHILETARALAPPGTALHIIDDYLENDFTLEAVLT